IRRPSPGFERRRGRGPPTPRRFTRPSCGWGTRPPTKPAPGRRGWRSLPPPDASYARQTAGSPPRRRAIPRRSSAGGSRPSGRTPAAPTDLVPLGELEGEGSVRRTRVDGSEAWCDRRLLARIHRYPLDRLRREIEPVTASEFLRFLAAWQHADPAYRLEGPRG